jgi:FKBP-type peptidyl-prolyl cis-trans isomerase FklB
MRFISTFFLLSTPFVSLAFAPASLTSLKLKQNANSNVILNSSSDEKEPIISKAPTEGFSAHEELMYALGVNLARQLGDIRPLVENGEELTYVAKGLLDAVVGRLNEEGQVTLLQNRQVELNELITDRANKIRQNVESAGDSMLNTMSETEGVETLESGVRVHILEGQGGGGPRPSKASTVKAHYHGTLPDGTIFDSTLGQDEPISLPVGALIPGFTEGLLKLREGETAMIGIPSSQAYGEEGSVDGRVPGGCAIFFKVQLIEILSAGIGGEATLLGADGKKLGKESSGSGLLGADGKPLFK